MCLVFGGVFGGLCFGFMVNICREIDRFGVNFVLLFVWRVILGKRFGFFVFGFI